MIKGIQLLGILVSIYLILQTILQYKKRNYGVKRTAFWLSLWTFMGILFAFPSLSLLALPVLSMRDAMLAVVVMALMVTYVLVYQMYQQLVRTERKLEKLAQNIALHSYLKGVMDHPEGDEDGK